jgi:3',5'-cyclic AMP phosphodiesterase CpdA
VYKKNFIIVSLLSILFFITFFLPTTAQTKKADDAVPYAGFEEINPAKNTFLLVGDTQSTSRYSFWRERNDRERQLIIGEITRREPAFVVHLGDLTVRGSSKRHWRQFDAFHQGFRDKKIPYFPILGNHEFHGNDERALQNYFGRFPHLAGRRCYRLFWKNIALILLDSNFPTLTPEEIDEQSRWYRSQLEQCEKDRNIDYVIVCCHEPPFTNSRTVEPNQLVIRYFVDPFVRFKKTRLFFSGHNHSYERFQIDDKFFIVAGGGGGPRHKVSIDPSKRRYRDLFPGPELRSFHFCEIEHRKDGIAYRVLRLEPDESFTVVDPVSIRHMRR